MKKNWKDIAIIIGIVLNVFQFLSNEAQEWYALTQQANPSTTEQKSISMGKVERINQDIEITKARGVK